MENFLKSVLELKIDFGNLILVRMGGESLSNDTELSPRDFIRFSKEDIKEETLKGLINSLTNAKRAIDCQIDNVLIEFGLENDKIDKASENLINDLNLQKKDLPYKLKLVQALGFAPGGLTAKVRSLRNKLEHSYKIPKRNEVDEAIEIAELFILSIESKMKMLDDHFVLSSTNFQHYDDPEKFKKNLLNPIMFTSQISVKFWPYTKLIEVTPIQNSKTKKKIIYKCDSSLYYYYLRLMNHLGERIDSEDDIKLILKHCNHPIPSTNIKFAEFY
jgi:hypothetical protein